MLALENMGDFVRKIIGFVRDVAGIWLRTVMIDREFFSVDVITALNEMKVSYLMPCRNTGAVVDAIGEFEVGKM